MMSFTYTHYVLYVLMSRTYDVVIYISLKKGIMFFNHSVCLSVCVSVIRIVTKWLDLATRY